MKKILIICLGFIVCFISGCGGVSTNTYKAAETGVASKVLYGTIIAQRCVAINNSTNVGGLAGASAGAVTGSVVGGSARSNIVGAIGGAVIGGIAGQAIDKAANNQTGIEYIIRLKKDDSIIAVTQANDLKLSIGQKILVIYGATTRIIPDETSSAEKHHDK